jgi:hypothetical protein
MWFACVMCQSVRTDCSQIESGAPFSLQKHVIYADKERFKCSRVPVHGHEYILQILFDYVLFWHSPVHIPSTRLHGAVIAM